MAFETMPVVHLEHGRLPEYPGADPEEPLTQLARRFGRVVVVDIQGIRRNDADLEFIQAAGRRRPLWLDAGSRYATDAMDLFVAGAERVTMRWNTLADASELEEAASICQPDSVYLGLEFPRGGFLRHPKDSRSAADAVRLAESAGAGVVFIVQQADAHLLRSLPSATTARFVQGAPAALADDAQSMGFQGLLLPASDVPPEAPS